MCQDLGGFNSKELEMNMTDLAKRLNRMQPAVCIAVLGEKVRQGKSNLAN